jgi:hypothetical protein
MTDSARAERNDWARAERKAERVGRRERESWSEIESPRREASCEIGKGKEEGEGERGRAVVRVVRVGEGERVNREERKRGNRVSTKGREGRMEKKGRKTNSDLLPEALVRREALQSYYSSSACQLRSPIEKESETKKR